MRKYAGSIVGAFAAVAALTVASAWPQGIRAQSPPATPACRALATSSAAKRTIGDFSSETRTTCQFDRPRLEYRCSVSYSDSSKTTSTTSLVTKYASIADVLDEAKVVPPLRRALSSSGYRDDRPASNPGVVGTAVLTHTNTYDAQGRLLSDTSRQESTVYSNWDQAGRPMFARTTGRGGTTVDRTMSYSGNELKSIVTTPTGVSSCTVVFDPRGFEISSSCVGPDAMTSLQQTKILETIQVCK